MKNSTKKLGLTGIVLSTVLGITNASIAQENNRTRTPTYRNQITYLDSLYNQGEKPTARNYSTLNRQDNRQALSLNPPVNNPQDLLPPSLPPTSPTLNAPINPNNNLEEKLIGYNMNRGRYIITDQAPDHSNIFGYITLEEQESLLKGRSYEGRPAIVKFDQNGKVRYMLPPGEYNISNQNGQVKNFNSPNPINIIELGYEENNRPQQRQEAPQSYMTLNRAQPRNFTQEQLAWLATKDIKFQEQFLNRTPSEQDRIMNGTIGWKSASDPTPRVSRPQAYSSTLVIREETPQGSIIRAVQPTPYQSIDSALQRPDVERYFVPRQN